MTGAVMLSQGDYSKGKTSEDDTHKRLLFSALKYQHFILSRSSDIFFIFDSPSTLL